MVKEPTLAGETLFGSFRRGIETHAEMTSYLTLLLATLGIMIGLFTVTGFINRMGAILLDLGNWHIAALIGMAWVFGWLAGTGLPPTATYIIGAIVIVPPMKAVGIDPWVAHFFVFLLSVWGELSPPTSLTAAVSARIANVSFMKTMFEALKICAPITLMTFAIFTRSNMVTTTGWLRSPIRCSFSSARWALRSPCSGEPIRTLVDRHFAALSDRDRCCPHTLLSRQHAGHYVRDVRRTHPTPAILDILLRCLVAAVSFVVMFHPDMKTSAAVAVVVMLAVVAGIYRHIQLAPKTYAITDTETDAAPNGDLAPVLAEAKRGIG